MVNKNEEIIRQKYESQGYTVLRNGAPDFVIFKNENGQITDIKFIEVKFNGDRLRYEQQVYKKILETLGLTYILEHIKATQDSPRQRQTHQVISNQD